jgi:hypothetical protein
VTELSTVAKQIAEQAKTLAVKADAAGSPPSMTQIEAMKRAINRLQNGLNRIQAETDAWAGEPLED